MRALRLALVVAVLSVLGLSGTAWAHAGFVDGEPEPGADLSSAPGVVLLRFSEPLNVDLSRASVTTPDGENLAGKVTADDEISVALATNAQGVYSVEWTTVSKIDGHTLSGTYRFGVGVPVGTEGLAKTDTSPRPGDLLISLGRVFEDAALLLGIGLLLLARIARDEPALAWVRSSPRAALGVAFAGGAAVVLGEALAAAPAPSLGAVITYLTTGLPGTARLLRPILEGAAFLLAGRRPRGTLVATVGALAALAAAGHAAAVDPRVWGIAVETVHLSSAGAWAGGILALGFQRPPGGWRASEGRTLLDRFTPIALFAFAATVTTGAIRGTQEVGSVHALFASSYGAVLLVKVVLVLAMVQLSVLAWRRIVVAPRLESIVVVAVLGATALLAAYPLPPSRLLEAERAAATNTGGASALPRPGDLTLGAHAGEFLIGLTVRSNPDELLVFVRGLDSDEETATRTVTVSVDGRPLDVTECGPTCRSAPAVLRGGEHVRVTVAGDGGGEASLAIPRLSSPPGDGLLDQMMTRMHALHSYRLQESLTSGAAVARATYSFQAPDRLTIDGTSSAGHSQVVWVGDTRYLREDGGPWTEEPAPSLPVPTFVWDSFEPFVDARVIAHRNVGGVRTDVVAFFGGDEGLPVWFRLWIDGTGLVHRAEMRAQGHFMSHRYFAFDSGIDIQPPANAVPGSSVSPTPGGTGG